MCMYIYQINLLYNRPNYFITKLNFHWPFNKIIDIKIWTRSPLYIKKNCPPLKFYFVVPNLVINLINIDSHIRPIILTTR